MQPPRVPSNFLMKLKPFEMTPRTEQAKRGKEGEGKRGRERARGGQVLGSG